MAHADTPSLPRLRSRVVSMRTFQRMAVVTLVILWLVVTTGALVRLTASGLGCPHWPTSRPTSSGPGLLARADRVLEPHDLGLAMLAAVAGDHGVPGRRLDRASPALHDRRREHGQRPGTARRDHRRVPDLNPYLVVISHFLLAMAVGLFSTWATVRALRPTRIAATPVARRLGLLAWASVVAYLALITSGAFVTAAGPHPGNTSTPIERLGNFYDSA